VSLEQVTGGVGLRALPTVRPRGYLPAAAAVASVAAIHLLLTAVNLSPAMDHAWVGVLVDMTREGTLVVWLSSATLLVIGGLIGMCALGAASSAERR
jgi:hypothetical protein